jgi:hypothetical protein
VLGVDRMTPTDLIGWMMLATIVAFGLVAVVGALA